MIPAISKTSFCCLLLLLIGISNLFGLTKPIHEPKKLLKQAHNLRRSYPDSARQLLRIFEIAFKEKASSTEIPSDEIAEGLYLIGELHMDTKQYSTAQEYFSNALSIATSNSTVALAVRTGIGTIYYRKKQLDSALVEYNKVLSVPYSPSITIAHISAINGVSLILRKQNQRDSALYLLDKAEKIAEKKECIRGLQITFKNQGLIYSDRQEWDFAEAKYERALKYALIAPKHSTTWE